MPDYLQLSGDERLRILDELPAGRESDPDTLGRWLAGEEDGERAGQLFEVLRPRLSEQPAEHWAPLLDQLVARHPRVAHVLAASMAAADVRSVVLPGSSSPVHEARKVDPIVAFYRGERPDAAGRFVGEIVGWPDRELEAVHDYIQWLFPTSQRSGVNPSAPLVTRETMATFAGDEDLRQGLSRSFQRMLGFYGLEQVMDGAVPVVRKGGNYPSRRGNWLTSGNHNHLRITRILGSLQLLGLGGEATAFGDCLHDIYQSEGPTCISPASFHFWMKAAGRRDE